MQTSNHLQLSNVCPPLTAKLPGVECIPRCSELSGGAGIRKASLPMRESRQQQVAAVRAAVSKRPARADDKPRRKRTLFTLKREGSLIVGGSKLSIFKPCAPFKKKPSGGGPYKYPAMCKRPAGCKRP